MQQVEIRVKGKIDPQRSDWFQGLEVIPAGAQQTILIGRVADQSALFGLLAKIRDLGLALISVQVADPTGQEV